VLEHVEDEQQVLTEIGRVLRPGGRLTISVPMPVSK
jgi:2-polyprenyl-3-methyl-5-hydroxy-6-metoxy-1,4-benzoquinol methylase